LVIKPEKHAIGVVSQVQRYQKRIDVTVGGKDDAAGERRKRENNGDDGGEQQHPGPAGFMGDRIKM
jgi:hypothetical protein